MRDYVHWASLGALCEFLPQAGNRVMQQQAGGGARSSSACHNRTELGSGPAGTGMADDYPPVGRFSTR